MMFLSIREIYSRMRFRKIINSKIISNGCLVSGALLWICIKPELKTDFAVNDFARKRILRQ